MKAGLIYSCKWQHQWMREVQGWDMLLFLRTETIDRKDGVIVTNYRFYDILMGKERLLDEGLIEFCKELNLEEI